MPLAPDLNRIDNSQPIAATQNLKPAEPPTREPSLFGPPPRSYKIQGPILTLVAILVMETLAYTRFGVPNPPAILVTLIVFSAFRGGMLSGTISAALSLLYIFYFYSVDRGFAQFNPEDLGTVILWTAAIPFMVWMVGALRGRLIDRRVAEQGLRESEDRFRTLVDNVQDYAIIMLDSRGHVRSWNAGAQRIFGYDSKEILGTHFSKFYLSKDRDSGLIQKAIQDAIGTGRHIHEGWRLRKDGSRFWASLAMSAVKDGRGRIKGFTMVTRDITEKKNREEELKRAKEAADRAKEAAEQANQAKTNFLANISHEIRTPLGAVLGYAELLMSPNQTRNDRQHYTSIIKKNGEMLSRIINDILDLSKIEANRIDITKEEFELQELLADLHSLFSRAAQEKGIRFQLTNDGPLPRTVLTDPTRVRQILMNVIGNAIKFTDNGTVSLRVSLLRPSDPTKSSHLKFTIKDQGTGIRDEQTVQLFRPFSQIDNSPTRRYGGTGLGLALSRRLAQALGGDLLLLESLPGRGSTFSITIDVGDLRNAQFIHHLDFSEHLAAATEPSPETRRLAGIHVLVVEDTPDNQMLISRFLKMAGATVDLAANGREALAKINRGEYDVVLMDIQMPELDGYQTTSRLRGNSYDRPIIALTAHAMKDERDRCLRAGCDDHLTKPINRELLIDRVAMFAGRRHIEEKLPEQKMN